ncbi:MAG: DUF4145 domain-containing protein [Ktedonobacteraceae bacterium]|nr:DUF4145 domain-containing protein [Ktedonobacteraceae bacterium]
MTVLLQHRDCTSLGFTAAKEKSLNTNDKIFSKIDFVKPGSKEQISWVYRDSMIINEFIPQVRSFEVDNTKRSLQCGHCDKLALFKIRGEGTQDNAKVIESPYHERQDIITWRILECEWCKKPTFEEVKTAYEWTDDLIYSGMVQIFSEITTLYPEANIAKAPLTNLPEAIAKKYTAALKVQDIEPGACAVLVGKTLEAICNHEKAAGTTLSDKVNNLLSSDRFPRSLAEMAHQLRQIRNLDAHNADDEVTEEDTPIILEFLEAILEYLYIAPAKIAAVQARLKKVR